MFTFSPLPHEAAVSRIAGLPLVSREVMDGLLPELRAYAFCVTGLDSFDQLAKVRDHIKAVPAGDLTWKQARKAIAGELTDGLGGKEAQRRAELLLRTHVFRSYAATRYRNLMQQVDVFPYWQYKTHGDGNVRPSHAALNGKIFPAGHQIWQRIFPPWDWGCRCLVVPLTKRSADAVMQRGRISDESAKNANLLKSQITTPEIFTPEEATIIDKNQRLPGGIPLNRTPTWSDSPWSEPGTVHHDWRQIKARYSDQPEVMAAFADWAGKQMITPGKTVSMWLDDAQIMAPGSAPAAVPGGTAGGLKPGGGAARPQKAVSKSTPPAAVKAPKKAAAAKEPAAKPGEVRPYMSQREIEDAAIHQVNQMPVEQMKAEALDYADKLKLPQSTKDTIARSRGKGEARSRAIQARMVAVRKQSEAMQLERAKQRGADQLPVEDDSDLAVARPAGKDPQSK